MPAVVTVAEMRAIDAAAPESVEVLIERAGRAVARAAIAVMGGRYGRRVVVVAGPGHNGVDGRVAARVLRSVGVGVTVFDAADAPAVLPPADVVIDAAYGTGLRSPYVAPDPGSAAVVAVDIPSGVDGDTGVASGSPMPADVTVTFAAYTPGLLLADGPRLAGRVVVADIGLPVCGAGVEPTLELVDDAWAGHRWPTRDRAAHKWGQAVLVIAGSPGMTGAAILAAGAAQRAGAGMVQLAVPGGPPVGPVEVVARAVDETTWATTLLAEPTRAHAVVIGPGLGTAPVTLHQVREFVRRWPRPIVVDGDGITALGADAAAIIGERRAPTVLTPHDGEFERLAGARPGADRIADVRSLAAATGAVVLAKGPTTIVARPDGMTRLVDAGDQRLATAGSGDVLAGMLGALLAAGLPALEAAALAAHAHGLAARACPDPGTVASDLVAALPAAIAFLLGRHR